MKENLNSAITTVGTERDAPVRVNAPQKNSKPFRRLRSDEHPTAQTLSVLGGRNYCRSLFRPPARSVGKRPNGRRGTRLCRRMGRELAHSGR